MTVVRDHCHFTGKFRGAAHQKCNLNLRKRVIIPAFFHNFSGYDSHLLFKSLSSLKNQPEVLAKSLEKFTMMRIGNIQIKDSLNFMSCSLDKLVSNLNEKGKKENKSLQETFPITYEYFKNKWKTGDEDCFEFLTRKGVYPYEYKDSWGKFKEIKLPDIDKFHSKLKGEGITEEDYKLSMNYGRNLQVDE